MIFCVDYTEFCKEFEELLEEGKSFDEAIEILKDKYGKSEESEGIIDNE